jgi:NAD(P)H-flavin reductase
MYQPRPLPIVNKVLPDNGTTTFILGFLTMNAAFVVVNIPFETGMLMVFGDRCATLFAANLPLLYLLAAKNQPLKYLTGFSYDALNIFHRRVGEMLCLFAALHMASSFHLYFSLLKPLLGISLLHFVGNRLILCGLIAFVCYESLYLTSLGSFRQRWYELFLASHIVLQAAGLGFLWFHYFTSGVYVVASVAIFLADRILYRLILKSTSVTASLEVLEDGETVLLSADWAIEKRRPLLIGRRSIKNGWKPAEHVFITAPALGKSAMLQAHPFTIASAAPDMEVTTPYAWFSLLIRAHDGFSRDLLKYTHTETKLDVRIDGPYGTLEPLRLLQDSGHAVVIAGGSGIAVVFPLIWALLQSTEAEETAANDNLFTKHTRNKRRVSLIWVIHSSAHASWLPKDRLDELSDRGLDVRIPPPTATHGRPDLASMVEDLVYSNRSLESDQGRTGIVVSGPDAMNRDVRNTCSRMVREGMDVKVTVEKFGW